MARNFDIDLIDEILDELTKRGVLNDERFAETYIRRRAAKGFGPLHIQDGLRMRGVEDEVLVLVLDIDNSIWIKRAYNAKNKRFGHSLPTDRRVLLKQIRFLQQRGFTIAQIKRVLYSDDEEDFDYL